MTIISHPTGNANVRAAAIGLHAAQLLAEFHTTIASFEGSFIDKLGKLPSLADIKRRRFDPSLQPITHQLPGREICRLLSSKAGFSKLVKHETGVCSIDAVYRSLDKKVANRLYRGKNKISGVYAYEDGALESFRVAKKHGLNCFYDLPAAYWKTVRILMQKERDAWPDWISTMNNLKDSDGKLANKDEELSLADCIFVASTFTANSLNLFNGKLAKVKVIPYGFPPVNTIREHSASLGARPLKVLYVGKLSQQKGIANLFNSVKDLQKHVELTIVGRKVNNLTCKMLENELVKHKWIPSLSHPEILNIMRANDIVIFPSISDGFGLVITEAMSQGTPVIASNHSAGPDLITPGENGWICEAGSTSSLRAQIEMVLSNPKQIARASEYAIATARQRPWGKYGEELSDAIRVYQS